MLIRVFDFCWKAHGQSLSIISPYFLLTSGIWMLNMCWVLVIVFFGLPSRLRLRTGVGGFDGWREKCWWGEKGESGRVGYCAHEKAREEIRMEK